LTRPSERPCILDGVEYITIRDGAGHYLTLPSLSTAERDSLSPDNGMLIYNSSNNRIEAYENGSWGPIGSGGGASAFVDLTDTPSGYTGDAGLAAKVKNTEDGLEFSKLDHGAALTGLNDDDHPQYLLADGSRALAGNLDADGYNISNLGKLSFDAATELTISGGAITVSQTFHTVDTESDASTDDLNTINGSGVSDVIYLRAANAAHTVVIKHGADNIVTPDGNDYELDDANKIIQLIYDSSDSKWHLVGSAGGGGGGLTAVVDDTSPQLGGDLDAQNHAISDVSSLATSEVKARDANGLKLTDDTGDGIFVVDGNVGIRTTSPDAPLHIKYSMTTAGAPALKIEDTDAPGGFFQISESTSISGRFAPEFKGASVGYNDLGLSFLGIIPETNDVGTNGDRGAVIFDGRTDAPGALSSSHIAVFRTYGTAKVVIAANGRLGVGTTSPGYTLDVSGDIHCTGKLTSDGGNDPPYVLYNHETRSSIVERIKKEVLPDKLNGAVLFFNGDRSQLELFLPNKGEFRSLDGKVLETVEPITQTFGTEDRYYFDEDTGELKTYKAKKAIRKYRLKPDHELDPRTGKIKHKIKEIDSKTGEEVEIGEEEVSLDEAIEQIKEEKAMQEK